MNLMTPSRMYYMLDHAISMLNSVDESLREQDANAINMALDDLLRIRGGLAVYVISGQQLPAVVESE